MYWSQWDTAILVTGILTMLLAALPVRSLTPRGRLGLVGGGALLVVIALVLGNSPSFTYPSIVEIGPAFPIGGAVLLIAQHVRGTKRAAEAAAAPPVATMVDAQPAVAQPAPVPAPVTAEPQPVPVAAAPNPQILAAADPATPLETLADLAYRVPETRAAVASNPSTYPGLLEWLAQLDDPQVNAALAGRVSAP